MESTSNRSSSSSSSSKQQQFPVVTSSLIGNNKITIISFICASGVKYASLGHDLSNDVLRRRSFILHLRSRSHLTKQKSNLEGNCTAFIISQRCHCERRGINNNLSNAEDPQQPNYSGVTPGQCVVPVCRVISSWAQNVTDGDPSLMQQSLQHPKQQAMCRGDQTNEKRERSSLCIKGRNQEAARAL